MKIVHVITRLILGGAQENTILSCEGLHRRGHEVTLITGPAIGPEGQLLARARSGGYELVVLEQMRRAIHPWRDLRSLLILQRLLRRLRPDVVHSHSSKAGILARHAARRVGVPVVVHTIHGLPFHPYQSALLNRFYIMLERQAADVSDAIVSVADAMTRQALAAGVGRAGLFETIYSGLEVGKYLDCRVDRRQVRRSLGVPADAVVFATVSRLSPLKGHEYLLSAVERLVRRRDDMHFLLVGDGWLRRQIERRIRQGNLQRFVTLTGLVEPDRIPEILHASDAVVHVSLREGLARVLPQAMLCGKCVISYDVDGAREVVLPGRTGFLLPPKSVGSLVDAIERVADDTQLRTSLGKAGRRLCREMFDAELMVDKLQALYLRLLNRRKRNSKTNTADTD